ncbi:MAG TPA: hypothetical protein VLC91_11285, partial [Spongiibacteraceae bacterium]|nr:hypothetical protein [Spongiibacteraceae bacterium]
MLHTLFNPVLLPLLRSLNRAALYLTVVVFAACSTTSGYNPTVYPFEINKPLLQQKPPKKLVIATANVSGEPTRFYLQKAAGRIDEMVKVYLEKHGYQIAPSYVFENAWNQAIRTYGDMYDPTTGRVDPATWRAVMLTTAKTLQDSSDIDAIVFTDVIERDAAHDVGMDHLARWDGVSRKPGMVSAGADGVPAGFNWSQSIKVASLAITIYSTNMEGLFSSHAGLDTLQAIDTKNEAT